MNLSHRFIVMICVSLAVVGCRRSSVDALATSSSEILMSSPTPLPLIATTALSPTAKPTEIVPSVTSTKRPVPTAESVTLTLIPTPSTTSDLRIVSPTDTDWGDFIERFREYGGVFSPDHSLLATALIEDTSVIEVATGEVRWTFEKEPAPINGTIELEFSPDSTLLANGGSEGIAYIWDVNSGEPVHEFPFGKTITDVEFSRDGNLFAMGWAGTEGIGVGDITIWNLNDSSQIHFPESHLRFGDIAFSPNEPLLAISVQGPIDVVSGTVLLWNVLTNEIQEILPTTIEGLDSLSLDQRPLALGEDVAFSPDGQRLAVVASNVVTNTFSSSVRLWNTNGKVEIELQDAPVVYGNDWIVQLLFSSNDVLAGKTSAGHIVVLWDKDGRYLGHLQSETRILDMTFTPDGRYLVSFVPNASPIVLEVPRVESED
jgi:WD40 repeat protein